MLRLINFQYLITNMKLVLKLIIEYSPIKQIRFCVSILSRSNCSSTDSNFFQNILTKIMVSIFNTIRNHILSNIQIYGPNQMYNNYDTQCIKIFIKERIYFFNNIKVKGVAFLFLSYVNKDRNRYRLDTPLHHDVYHND